MSKRYKQPIHRDTEARTRSGLLSLFWMFVGAVIAVMVGVFLYMSPLFDGFRTEVEVNPPAEVTPLPQAPQKSEYEFYEILPKREFKGGGSGLGEQKLEDKAPIPDITDEVEDSEEAITIVEEEATYDDPATTEPAPKPKSGHVVKLQEVEELEIDRLIAEMMMLGVDVNVKRHYDSENGDRLEVMTAPMSKEQAYEAHRLLSKNGIKSIVVENK